MARAVTSNHLQNSEQDQNRHEVRELNEEHEIDDETVNQYGSAAVRDHAVVDEDLQHSKFGGFHFSTAFFGWLVSAGLGTILIAILTAAGSALAVTQLNSAANVASVSGNTAATVGLVSGILFALVLAVAYYAGGYVAARMARFDGIRQGFGVWLIGIVLTLLLAGLGTALGAKYNIVQQLNLPHIPINQGSFTKAGLITTVATIVLTLLASIFGGRAGEQYHRKIDSVGTVDRATFAPRM